MGAALRYLVLTLLVTGMFLPTALAQDQQAPKFISDDIQQYEIANGYKTVKEIRKRGLIVFSTPFTNAVGFGDGPMDPLDTISPGGRPTLGGNGSFLRVNGLDAQSCLECHSVVSNLTVPCTFGVGGAGGISASAISQPTEIDVTDSQRNSFAAFDGRLINPPFLFGSGGVELLAKEMTAELRTHAAAAKANPGVPQPLVARGISFGVVVYRNGALDTSGVEGIDDDLVVRPFGRKGEFISVRAFAAAAMQFHFGMQPVELAGPGIDADRDGVVDELSEGDVSAVAIFGTTLERPVTSVATPESELGRARFQEIGCATCHVPSLHTRSPILTYSLPEVPADPSANVYFSADLRDRAPGFTPSGGGVEVPLYSDLKRHDMGPKLSESRGDPLDSMFITARLWGIADSAPYLHDGRAHTLEDAILLHGGEAQPARDAFSALSNEPKRQLISFLMTLRTPFAPAAELLSTPRASRSPPVARRPPGGSR
jgi:di-heme oxidoreductase (putative peroxidase)